MGEYLWDRSGGDAEIERLEAVLAPLRHARPLDVRRLRRPRWAVRDWMPVAAGVVVCCFAWRLQMVERPAIATGWAVSEVRGVARVGGRTASAAVQVRSGDRVETGEGGSLTIEADGFGEVELGAGSELRVLGSQSGRQQMNLERGQIHAFIWAAPRQFVVDTPSARAVDLGCAYSLTVDESGDGFLTVETGWVAFQVGRRESFIPRGAACRTTKKQGPGIPFYLDAPVEWRSAVAAFEMGDRGALTRVLDGARAKDGLTLWHLLGRTSGDERRRVFERFVQLVRLPDGVDAARVESGDAHAMDLCWNALALDDANWWREWKRDWKQ